MGEEKKSKLNYLQNFSLELLSELITGGLDVTDYRLDKGEDGFIKETYFISCPKDSYYYQKENTRFRNAEEMAQEYKRILTLDNVSNVGLLYLSTNFSSITAEAMGKYIEKMMGRFPFLLPTVKTKIRDEEISENESISSYVTRMQHSISLMDKKQKELEKIKKSV